MNLGDKIKKIREKKGISQLELAKKMGYVSNSYIGDVESGRFIPSKEKLKKIAKALGVPFEELEDPWFEVRIKELGIKKPELVALFRDIPKLPQEEKKRIINAYLEIVKKLKKKS